MYFQLSCLVALYDVESEHREHLMQKFSNIVIGMEWIGKNMNSNTTLL